MIFPTSLVQGREFRLATFFAPVETTSVGVSATLPVAGVLGGNMGLLHTYEAILGGCACPVWLSKVDIHTS